MICPKCKSRDWDPSISRSPTHVVDTVTYDTFVRRIRACPLCGHRYITNEKHDIEETETYNENRVRYVRQAKSERVRQTG